MTIFQRATAFAEDRSAVRQEVHYRARGHGPDGRGFMLLIANISARGLMARCDAPYQVGDRLTLTLPLVGETAATIRWSLGGRIGCEFDAPIAPVQYFPLLAVLPKS
jgi:hypothetical protein